MFKLGQKARDKVTGFDGILTARCTYFTGCDQYSIQPPAKDGKVESSMWFDETRIEITGNGVTLAPVATPKKGGPQNTPAGRNEGNPESRHRGPA